MLQAADTTARAASVAFQGSFIYRLLGLHPSLLTKVLLTAALIVGLIVATKLLRLVTSGGRARPHGRIAFWIEQGIRVAALVVFIVGVLAVWFASSDRLASVLGLLTAGLAVALQRVVTAFAGYLVIVRGNVFSLGDRITIGGVRGDVVALGFMQTTVMEMGEPPAEQSAEPAMWVHSRQYTGRLVRVTNDKIFDSPVYNYTREFPFVWEEIHLPTRYQDDRHKVEQILLEAARRHTADIIAEAKPALAKLRDSIVLPENPSLEPAVYYRLTDNWLELTVRFVARTHGVRGLKDTMNREILASLDAAGIGIASGTYAIVEMPPLQVELKGAKP